MPQIDFVLFNSQVFWFLFFFFICFFAFKYNFFIFAFFFFFLRYRNLLKYTLVRGLFEQINWLFIFYLVGTTNLFPTLVTYANNFFLTSSFEFLFFSKLLLQICENLQLLENEDVLFLQLFGLSGLTTSDLIN